VKPFRLSATGLVQNWYRSNSKLVAHSTVTILSGHTKNDDVTMDIVVWEEKKFKIREEDELATRRAASLC